jgi:predicted dehydrogenase
VTVGVAVIGCGMISHEYVRNLTRFPDLRVLACADLDVARAREVPHSGGGERWRTTVAAVNAARSVSRS